MMTMEQETLETIAQRYRDDGYSVVVHPVGDAVPAFAAGFQPDIIARKGNDGVIVEVKTNRIGLANDPAPTQLAAIVDSQPGWRLDLIVQERETSTERAAEDAAEPSDEELAKILTDAEELADNGLSPYACVVAWGGLEAAMRRVRDEAELYGKATPIELMRTLYGNGFLSRDQFDKLRDSYKIRSQVVHGLIPTGVSPEVVRYVTAVARFLAHEGGLAAASI